MISIKSNKELVEDLTNNIYQEISSGKSVLLVGPTDSGKTWYIKNTLIPFLQEKKMGVIYFPDADHFQETEEKPDIFIIDEVETLIDRDFLESNSPDSKPYYSEEYLAKVKVWHDKLKKLNTPSIFILTRNNQAEIDNILENLKVVDWGTEVRCLAFTSRSDLV